VADTNAPPLGILKIQKKSLFAFLLQCKEQEALCVCVFACVCVCVCGLCRFGLCRHKFFSCLSVLCVLKNGPADSKCKPKIQKQQEKVMVS
jgi:hypothetical protein